MTNFNASTMDCIEAMRVQEDTTIRCCNYFHRTKAGKDVDESSRKAMIEWCQQVQKSLNFSPETVWIAISFFDRYLSSGKGKSGEALDDRYKFQLAAISAFYVAIKIHEPVELNADTLARLCHNYYEATDILSIEEDILFALDWKVSSPTPMDFVRQLLELLPESKMSPSVSDRLLATSQKHLDHVISDLYFVSCKPSVVGAGCLASSLSGTGTLSSYERQAFWFQLGRITDLIDVMYAQNMLLKGRRPCKPILVAELTKKTSKGAKASNSPPRKSLITSADSSPVCVTQTARQA